MTTRERLLIAQLRLDARAVIQTATDAFNGKQTDLDLEDAIEDLVTSTDRMRSYVQDWMAEPPANVASTDSAAPTEAAG